VFHGCELCGAGTFSPVAALSCTSCDPGKSSPVGAISCSYACSETCAPNGLCKVPSFAKLTQPFLKWAFSVYCREGPVIVFLVGLGVTALNGHLGEW
jgi:hypothetical protein